MNWVMIGITAILITIGMWRVVTYSRYKHGWQRWLWVLPVIIAAIIGIALGIIL